jgi:hypothetical protein
MIGIGIGTGYRERSGGTPRVKVIVSGTLVKAVCLQRGQWTVHEFTRDPVSRLYTHGDSYYALDNTGEEDLTKPHFNGSDVHPACTMYGDSVYGNHGWSIVKRVTFSVDHDLDVDDIGKEMTCTSGTTNLNKKFCIWGIYSSNKLCLIGEFTGTGYANPNNYQPMANDVLTLGGTNHTVTLSSDEQLKSAVKNTLQILAEDISGNLTEITGDGTYVVYKLHYKNLGQCVHPRSVYDYLVANAGDFTDEQDTVNGIIVPDVFFDFKRPSPAIVTVQKRNTEYILDNEGTMLDGETIISTISEGGVDAPTVGLSGICGCVPSTAVKMYVPKIVASEDTNHFPQPCRELPATATVQATSLGKRFMLSDHDTEFGASGKKRCAERGSILTGDLVNGIANGQILNYMGYNTDTKYIIDSDYSLGTGWNQGGYGKVLFYQQLSAGENDQTLWSWLKLLVNPYPDICTQYEYIRIGSAVYLYVDFHKTITAWDSIPFPKEFVGYDCEIIEQTDALILTGDTSRVLADGFPVEYTYHAVNSPYAFAIFKLTPHAEPVEFEPQTLLYFDRITEPTSQRKIALNTLIKELRDNADFYGIIDCLWIPTTTDTDSRKNILQDAFNLIPLAGGSPTFTEDEGWIGFGTKGFSTQYDPSTANKKYQLTKCTMGIYVLTTSDNNGIAIGSYHASGNNGIYPKNSSNQIGCRYNWNSGVNTPYLQTTNIGIGMFAFTLHGGYAFIYKNGKLVATTLATPTAFGSNTTISLLYVAILGQYLNNGKLACAWLGWEQTERQHANTYLAIQKYMTVLGKQV